MSPELPVQLNQSRHLELTNPNPSQATNAFVEMSGELNQKIDSPASEATKQEKVNPIPVLDELKSASSFQTHR